MAIPYWLFPIGYSPVVALWQFEHMLTNFKLYFSAMVTMRPAHWSRIAIGSRYIYSMGPRRDQ